MEIKAQLIKPYSEKQRIKFLVEQNHKNGYKILETETSLDAMGKTDDEILVNVKLNKTKEALNKAQDYITNVGCYMFEEDKSIEINDGNVAKLTAYTVGMKQGLYREIVWVTKEDEIVTLKLEDIMNILQGIAKEQSKVWVKKYPYYLEQIEKAKTLEDINKIVINYNSSQSLSVGEIPQ